MLVVTDVLAVRRLVASQCYAWLDDVTRGPVGELALYLFVDRFVDLGAP